MWVRHIEVQDEHFTTLMKYASINISQLRQPRENLNCNNIQYNYGYITSYCAKFKLN